MLRLILAAALLGSSPFAMAAGPTFVVKQLQLARQRVVVESSAEIEPGTELIATFRNGSQCTLRITAAQGHLANADVSECASAQSMVAGQQLERSLFVEENPRPRPPKNSGMNNPSAPASPKWTPHAAPPRGLTDLQYMPRAGQFALGVGLGFNQKKTSISLSPGNDKVTDTTVESYTTSAEFIYAPVDRFAFGVVTSYLVGSTSNTSFGPGSAADGTKLKTKADGLQDPTIKAIYRLTEQDTVPVIVDFTGAYSPNSGKQKVGNTTSRGTGYRGSDLFSLGVELGTKYPSYSIAGGLNLSFYGTGNAVEATSGVGTPRSGMNVYTLHIDGQVEVGERLFLRGKLERIMMGEYSYNDGQEATVDSVTATQFTATLVKEMSPDHFAMEFSVSKQLAADFSSKQGTNTSNYTTEALGVGVAANFAF